MIVSTALIILVVAALVSYAVAPLAKLFQRVMPRALAILLVYLVIVGVVFLLLYLLVITSIAQVKSLANATSNYLFARDATGAYSSPLLKILHSFGVTQSQLQSIVNQLSTELASLATELARDVVPLITGIAGALVNILLTVVISIYLIVDGERAVNWIRHNAPLVARGGTTRLIEIFRDVVGGYVRGQILLSMIVGVLVGIGMALIGVPYAVLLGTLAGLFEFIPVIGTIASGIICCLLALSRGWLIFVLALGYFVVLHVFEGYWLSPRVVGKAVGLHPVVSLLALAAGGELFGPLGAILAAPVAGLIQSVLVSIFLYYQATHREQFSPETAEE
jgi:predicted PurR-regulated permease PerM